jgi:hypothetical protein
VNAAFFAATSRTFEAGSVRTMLLELASALVIRTPAVFTSLSGMV